jgi:CubicO group peptidase (beta-lactamase class C family)
MLLLVTATRPAGAVAEGRIAGVDRTVAQLLPDRAARLPPAVAKITLRQVLTMTGGLPPDPPDEATPAWMTSDDRVSAILSTPPRAGDRIAYSSAGSHLLAAVLVQATGRSVLAYARDKLFDPLGIDTRGAAEPVSSGWQPPPADDIRVSWPTDPQGVNLGFSELILSPADLTKLGQLYLAEGRWRDRQLIPAAWVRDATRALDPTQQPGYGYRNAGQCCAFQCGGEGRAGRAAEARAVP